VTILKIPRLSLVVLVGVSGSGKSTFAARHFRATEVLRRSRRWKRSLPSGSSSAGSP